VDLCPRGAPECPTRWALRAAGIYKDTVNLPCTTFNMRANSVQREPELQAFWEEQRTYETLRDCNPGVRTMRTMDALCQCTILNRNPGVCSVRTTDALCQCTNSDRTPGVRTVRTTDTLCRHTILDRSWIKGWRPRRPFSASG
jgi:hypothetical protein